MTRSSRYVFIDAIRGLAALSVVLFHLGRDFLGLDFLYYGKHGVTVFFVISGFVIARSLDDKAMTGRFVGIFMLQRSVRLAPTYWLCIGIALLVYWLPSKIFNYAISMPSFSDLALHLFYLQDLAQVPPINVVFWTLCYEIQFYLALCLIYFVVEVLAEGDRHMSRYTIRVVFLIPVFLFSMLWPLGLEGWLFPQGTMRGLFIDLWFLFLLGVFAYLGMTNKVARNALILAALILMLKSSSLSSIIGVLTSLMFFAVGITNRLTQWLHWQWLQFLGLISYSLYLSHDIVGIYARDTGLHLANKYLDFNSESFVIFWVLFCILFCVLFAYGLCRLVEKPTHALSRRIGRAQSTD